MAEIQIIKASKSIEGTRNRSGLNLERLRVAAYCRVSTGSDEQINSLESQQKHYTDMIQRNPEWIFAGIYSDEAISGAQADNREAFQRLIGDCLAGKIDFVLVKSLSRFSRNTMETIKYIRLLKEHNVAILFEDKNIDTSKEQCEFLLTVLAAVAQVELENISENVKRGLTMKMERGELCGFQGALGYDYDTETKSICINEEEAEIVRYIFTRYISGVGSSVIARELTEQGYPTPRGLQTWNDSTVRGILRNEKYKGDILQGKTFTIDPISKRRIANMGEFKKFLLPNHHEAIISAEDFDKAQDILAKRSHSRLNGGKRERYSRKFVFSSKLKCGFCGGGLSRRSWNSGTRYEKIIWQCATSTKHGKTKCSYCKGIPESVVESAFVESYNLIVGDNSDLLDEFMKRMEETLDIQGKRKALLSQRKALADRKTKKNKLLELNLDGLLDKETFTTKYQQLSSEENEINSRIAELTDDMESGVSASTRIAEFRKVLGANTELEKFDPLVFEAVVDYILVGEVSEDGTHDPYYLTFVFKDGSKQTQRATGMRISKMNQVTIPNTTHVETVVKLCRNKA